ncbi:hypothetical protein D9M71_303670 [compost metagenome]
MHDHDHAAPNTSRADYHRTHQARAQAEAERLLAARGRLGVRWLAWVAGELYALSPPQFASMVRRELQRLQEGG